MLEVRSLDRVRRPPGAPAGTLSCSRVRRMRRGPPRSAGVGARDSPVAGSAATPAGPRGQGDRTDRHKRDIDPHGDEETGMAGATIAAALVIGLGWGVFRTRQTTVGPEVAKAGLSSAVESRRNRRNADPRSIPGDPEAWPATRSNERQRRCHDGRGDPARTPGSGHRARDHAAVVALSERQAGGLPGGLGRRTTSLRVVGAVGGGAGQAPRGTSWRPASPVPSSAERG